MACMFSPPSPSTTKRGMSRAFSARCGAIRPHILVVNDGSTDGTADILARQEGLEVITHPDNRGYGAALISAFDYARQQAIRRAGHDGLRRPA